jgi:hypothetical protein
LLWYIAVLQSRVDPPELFETMLYGAIAGLALAVATTALIQLGEVPRQPRRRLRFSVTAGILVFVLSTASLFAWHSYVLSVRARAKALTWMPNTGPMRALSHACAAL